VSCLRKGFKANNTREARRYPGLYTWLPVSSVCDTAQALMEMSLPGEFLRGDDANIVCKTFVVVAQMIIGTGHIVFSFMLAPVLHSSQAAH